MADKKISDFTSKPIPTGDDFIELETAGGNSRKCTVDQLSDVIGGGYTDEMARDAIGSALTAGSGITVTASDLAETITIASTVTQYTDEMARDAIGTALVAADGITITPNDGSDLITIASTITQYTDEMARDALGAALVAGANITITPNDGANTITIASSGGGGGGGYEKGAPVVPAAASFTAVNPGTGTFTDGTSALLGSPQLNGNLASYVKTTPAAPFSIYCRINTAFLQNSFTTTGQSICGIALRNGGAPNNQLTVGIEQEKSTTNVAPAFYASIVRWNSTGGFSSRSFNRLVPNDIVWIRADVTSTDVTMFISFDAENWISVGVETIATHVGAITQYGLGFYGVATNNNQTSVIRYLGTSAPA